MYEKLDRSTERVLGYEVHDELTERDLDGILQDIEEAIHEEGSVRLLVHISSLPRPELDALDEDLGFWLEHGDDIDRYAVVGDSTLLEWGTELGDTVTSATIRYFEEDALDDAWTWVEEQSN